MINTIPLTIQIELIQFNIESLRLTKMAINMLNKQIKYSNFYNNIFSFGQI